jgi:2-hydroxychromene-2-carboxylate isomerase
MPAPIAFYFDFSSPYGYLAAQRIDDLAAAQGREADWRPFLLGAVFKTTGSEPLLNVPLKGDYARRDLARSARRFDIPFVLPEVFPFPSVSACRASYWLKARDPAAARRLMAALYRSAFAEGRDIRSAEAVAEVAAALGHDRDALLAVMQDPEIKQTLKDEVAAAIEKGVFGSPYIVVDGEPFWGFDRFPDVALWLERGGW